MPPVHDDPPSESKLKQVGDAAADAFVDAAIGEAIAVTINGASKVASAALEIISGTGQVAADCGAAAIEAACQAAGSIVDGV